MKADCAGAYGPTVVEGVQLDHTLRHAGQVRLHCVEAGPEDGSLVLLLHGFPECWWGWRRQIAPLARAGFRVVAPDQRGYGTSDKPAGVDAYRLERLASDAIALATALGGPRPFRLVGHDWGGIVAWWAAAQFPERVERLAVLNAPHPAVIMPYLLRSPAQVLRSAYVGFFQLPWLPETVLSARDFRRLTDVLTRTSRPGAFSAADFAVYDQAWSQPGALTAMLNWYRALPRSRRNCGRVRAPALVLWGARDIALQQGLAEASLACCDSGRLQALEAATHWVQHEEAAAVGAALAAFLAAGRL